MKQSQNDAGVRPGLTTEEQAELSELRTEVKELRRSKLESIIGVEAAAIFLADKQRRRPSVGELAGLEPLAETTSWPFRHQRSEGYEGSSLSRSLSQRPGGFNGSTRPGVGDGP